MSYDVTVPLDVHASSMSAHSCIILIRSARCSAWLYVRRTAFGSVCANCLSIQSDAKPISFSRVLPVILVACGLYLPPQPSTFSICRNDAVTIGFDLSSR